MRNGGDGRSDQDANLQVDRKAAAIMLNVSERSVASAAIVRDKATPELQAAVEQGHICVGGNHCERPQESAPAGARSWGRPLKVPTGGNRHHSDVGSRSADPIKFCVKS